MGIYCYDESTKDAKCDFCGERFEDVAQMYSCDSCSKKDVRRVQARTCRHRLPQ